MWKCFTRGHNPAYRDPFSRKSAFGGKPDLGIRRNIGYVSVYAQKMALAAMSPHGELASSRYCLADPGREYLVYLPDGGAVEVDLSAAAGELSVEWLSPKDGSSQAAGTVRGGARRSLQAPFAGDAVLYLKAGS